MMRVCRVGAFLASLCLLSACATTSQRMPGVSDHPGDFRYPNETENLVLVDTHVYDEPLLGISLKYRDKTYHFDLIDVYVYPIGKVSWEDAIPVLKEETARAVQEIDAAVKRGIYLSQQTYGGALEIALFAGTREYRGVKLQTEITTRENAVFASLIYLFIQQDKFIKFRVSKIKAMDGISPDTDYALAEILAELVVPPESRYMAILRQRKREETANQLLKLIQQALESKNGEGTTEAGK
jgi:hypothetical protein